MQCCFIPSPGHFSHPPLKNLLGAGVDEGQDKDAATLWTPWVPL